MNDLSSKPAILVTMRHARACGLCSQGSRAFAKKNGLDWSSFVKNGISVEELEATGDAMALKVSKFARELAEKGE